MSIWGLPLITALVAGDIVASESHNGTLKTILTRSRERGEVFAGKVLATATYTLALVFAMGLVGLVAGQHRLGLPSAHVALGHEGLARARASPADREPRDLRRSRSRASPPSALMLSTVTRNSAASVVGALMWALLMQLLGVLPGTESFRPYLLGTQFDAWHGFLRVPADWVPVIGRSGSARSTSGCRSSPPTSSSSAATSPASSGQSSSTCTSTPRGALSRLPRADLQVDRDAHALGRVRAEHAHANSSGTDLLGEDVAAASQVDEEVVDEGRVVETDRRHR